MKGAIIMQKIKKLHLIILIAALLSLFCGQEKEPQIPFEGKVTSITGQAQIFNSNTSQWVNIDPADKIEFGDSIRTPAGSQVEITFGGNNTFKIGGNSKVTVLLVKDSANKNVAEVFTVFGSVLSNVEKLTAQYQHYQVRTPTATASVKGTFFFVFFHPHNRVTHVNVFRGRVRVRNPHVIKRAPIILLPGFFTIIHIGKVPVVPKKLNYGQMKKVMPLMPPGQYKKFHKKFKIKKFEAKPSKGIKIKSAKGKIFKAKAIRPKGPKKAPHKLQPVPKKKVLKKSPIKAKPGKQIKGKVITKKKKGSKGGKKK